MSRFAFEFKLPFSALASEFEYNCLFAFRGFCSEICQVGCETHLKVSVKESRLPWVGMYMSVLFPVPLYFLPQLSISA